MNAVDVDWATDLQAVALTLKLAFVVTALLLVLGTPLAWWLAHTRSRWKAPLAALVALPLVLPPTVLGFYLLMLMGPHGWVGKATQALGIGLLPFSFAGLVIASMLYSMPFVVQPLQTAFEAIGARPLEAAATLRAGPWERFAHVALPLARRGMITAAVLGFAHTVGEFGVVLMIGGNIPGATRVISTQLYNHVEALEYPAAHRLAALLLVFSFAVLLWVYRLRTRGALIGPPSA
ncbi:molybdate ABC transporter permease subunit [Scleromatobacter humisilvae]|uniref:Molybdenum transport system permease n=1 Tax=Scleromatobacter humisilvae TaxID=2897159 RepID=A0A9X1YFU5_9BURK|nr:molybdate ABC transporter permease subunit [Scleromatobacter humisilvae]MCK9685268.1 molybdate ABC transporter permease subunit [Scleromatobacter humisilvae]